MPILGKVIFLDVFQRTYGNLMHVSVRQRLVEDESIDVKFNATSHVTFTTAAFDDVSKVDINKTLLTSFSLNN